MGCGTSIHPSSNPWLDCNDTLFPSTSAITRLSIIPPETSASYKFKDQDYAVLAKECRLRNKLFEDPFFPPDGRSLYLSENSHRIADIDWLRPKVGD